MIAPLSFLCNVCGRQKSATNHWSVLRIVTLAVQPDGQAEPVEVQELRISRWNDALAADKESAHACGNACAQKMLERFLAWGSIEAPRTPAADPVQKNVTQAHAPVQETDCA